MRLFLAFSLVVLVLTSGCGTNSVAPVVAAATQPVVVQAPPVTEQSESEPGPERTFTNPGELISVTITE